MEQSKSKYEAGARNFRQLVHYWTEQVEAESVPMRSLVACSKAAGGQFALSESFVSNAKNLKRLPEIPSAKAMIALSETNRFLLQLQEGTQNQPIDPIWRKIPVLTINGQPADAGALMQVVSGEIQPSEIKRWSHDIFDEELDFEAGLQRYLKTLGVTLETLLGAYAVNNEAQQGRIALVLLGKARLEITEREQEAIAIANALTQILGREVTSDQVAIGICSLA